MHREKGAAFALIELLTVLSLLALLMSLLLPAARQVDHKAKALSCQNQLRQWGLGFSIFMNEHNTPVLDMDADLWEGFWRPYCYDCPELFLCPRAKRYEINLQDPLVAGRQAIGCGLGSKFTAWRWATRTPTAQESGPLLGSYGLNGSGLAFLDVRVRGSRTRTRSNVPVFLDSADLYLQIHPDDEPPAYDGHLTVPGGIKRVCIDRHGGTINSLFLDWSVRAVGLKELWTLDWSPLFNAQNAWTRAGGVRPEGWPAWMRAFKDY